MPATALHLLRFSQLIGVITGSMIPVVGVMAASGILKGLLALPIQFNVVAGDSDTLPAHLGHVDSMFFFLPMIIGFTAKRRWGRTRSSSSSAA